TALATAVAQLHDAVEAERIRLGTPAAALVIVKDGNVIHAAGYGQRNAESTQAVDADTMFAIGSTTKAFTAMLVMQAVDAGKLALSDSPKTCLPEFSLKDPEADAKVTIRDLLTHRTGLGATDMAWYAGGLTRSELLTVAAHSSPVAPYGQQVHYQNLMYVAAGECAATALGGQYETLIAENIFNPLGMEGASFGHAVFRNTANRAQGHLRVADHDPVAVPPKNIDAIAPAGAINASVNAMAPWLQVMLGGGAVQDTRLVSAANFKRIVAPHVTMSPGVRYGLGWVVDQWHGQPRVWHNGGIDGYYALISMLPEKGIGFVLLTADDSGGLERLVTDRVFALATNGAAVAPETRETASAEAYDGTYGIIGGFKAILATANGVTTLTVPGQAPYPLLVGDSKAKDATESETFVLGPPAPAGFRARLTGESDTRLLTLEQPQGPIALPWIAAEALAAAKTATLAKADMALLGTYHDAQRGIRVALIASEGRVALSVTGQAPAPLARRGEDVYGLDGLPNSFAVTLVRKKRRVVGIELAQPQGALSLTRVPGTEPVREDAATVLARVAVAHGSGAMAKHTTMEVHSTLSFVHQGVSGVAITRRAAPGRFAETLTLTALDKTLGTIWVGHDGSRGWEQTTFTTTVPLTAIATEALALQAGFDPWADPLKGWAHAEVIGVDVLPGADEPAILVQRTSDSGIVWTDAIGRRSLRLLQRTTAIPNVDGPPTIEVQRFGDYREIGGVQVPHAVESTTGNGTVVSKVLSVRFDGPIDAPALQPPAR
ncbi:MAG: beta-lactamase family protein, partial [Nannocystaceae bacterium]|nr:beta-lactamase family protein [Nannocystaceae bacterium]